MTTPPNKPLQEKNFIQEGYSKNPLPFWVWFFIVVVVSALMWGGGSWYATKMSQEIRSSPFLQVTNRELSVFLWQFPEYMRINARTKSGYLPGFQYQEKVSLYPDQADKFVEAPPELIFLYHTWDRLISKEYAQRSIPSEEFKEFLNYAEEWKPVNWPQAPKLYTAMVDSLYKGDIGKDLNDLPEATLPRIVRQSFQGWKNYFKEGDAINAFTPTYSQLHEFIQKYPHYTRNYWRNIVKDTTPNYLKTYTSGHFDAKDVVPKDEMSGFLRVALYNFAAMAKPSS